MTDHGKLTPAERMVRLVEELSYHAEGNDGDACWDLYDRYNPLAEAGAVILLPGERPPWPLSPAEPQSQPTG